MSINNLKGNIAIVTGTAQGIGLSTMKALLKEGVKVYGLDINEQKNNSEIAELRKIYSNKVVAKTIDLANPEMIDNTFNQIYEAEKRIDILINNAAVFSTISFVNDSYQKALSDYNHNMNVNCRGTFLCSKKVAPIMAKQKSGDIINVNTNHIKRFLFSVSKNEHSYDASKFAQMSISDSMAKELIQYGVRVNGICPAATRTPMLNNFFNPDDLPLTAERLGKSTRIPSLLEPDDVAIAIVGMLKWPKDAPIGKEYLVMYSKDCQKLSLGPVEEFAS